MAELFQKERLQPSLLDRLADDEPYKKAESREQRVLSFQKLKQSVLRDLQWLLNAGCLETVQDLSDYPQVKQSVLNFGIPDLTPGTYAAATDFGF
jgi:type VI secretion system protein ImpF